MSGDQTAQIQRWIEGLGAGDASAREALLACAAERLTRLTHKMLKDYPGVHRWEETDDVLQNAMLRLCRALETVKPPSVRDFFRLAAALIRRELIDQARRYSGPTGLVANYASRPGSGDEVPAPDVEVADSTYDPGRLAEWTGFHAQVEALPEEKREVFDLLFYQGLTQAEAAAALGVSALSFGPYATAASVWSSISLHSGDRAYAPDFSGIWASTLNR